MKAYAINIWEDNTALNRGTALLNGYCCKWLMNHGKKVAFMEAVEGYDVTQKKTVQGVVFTVPNKGKNSLEHAIRLLHKLGFAGCKASIFRDEFCEDLMCKDFVI